MVDIVYLQTDIWTWQTTKQQQGPVHVMICGRYTMSAENLVEDLYGSTEK